MELTRRVRHACALRSLRAFAFSADGALNRWVPRPFRLEDGALFPPPLSHPLIAGQFPGSIPHLTLRRIQSTESAALNPGFVLRPAVPTRAGAHLDLILGLCVPDGPGGHGLCVRNGFTPSGVRVPTVSI